MYLPKLVYLVGQSVAVAGAEYVILHFYILLAIRSHLQDRIHAKAPILPPRSIERSEMG